MKNMRKLRPSILFLTAGVGCSVLIRVVVDGVVWRVLLYLSCVEGRIIESRPAIVIGSRGFRARRRGIGLRKRDWS